MTSTYTPASCVSTGIRCARMAPSTRPIAVATAIPSSETSIVRFSPSSRAWWYCQMTDHSKLARRFIGSRERPRHRGRSPRIRSDAGAIRRKVLAHRVGETRLPLARDVVVEAGPEPLGGVVVQDLHELVAGLHEPQRRVDPVVHRRVTLADADAPRDVQELV